MDIVDSTQVVYLLILWQTGITDLIVMHIVHCALCIAQVMLSTIDKITTYPVCGNNKT